jgi:polysaccharide export outer membrane protein
MNRNSLSALLLILLLSSCRTPRDVSYFQGIDDLTEEQKEAMNQKYVPRICIDDALVINVTSPDRGSVTPFTPPPYGYYMPGEAEIGIMATTQNLFTYLVDENGYINFPVLGRVHLAGLTINESIRLMEQLIWEYAPKAVVSVQVANFKVGIFGEVGEANVFTVKTPRVSILDLIAMAGDLTIWADRKNVWVHRDHNGKKEHARLDLTDPAIFASPYYYLQQNDMVYVMPNKARKRNSKVTENDNVFVTMCTVIVSSISLVITTIIQIRGQK